MDVTWVMEKNMPNVLIFGNSGNGKTTAGVVLGKKNTGLT